MFLHSIRSPARSSLHLFNPMDYDYRNAAAVASPYDSQIPMMYRSSASSSYPLYPRVGQPPPPPLRHPNSLHQASSSPSSSSGLGIRVAIKPQYRITPPPQLSPQVGDVAWSNFQFDFELERKIGVEEENESQNWSRLALENLPTKTNTETSSSLAASALDPVVSKYISLGLSRQAVVLAVAIYGDNPTKVREFANAHTLLNEMGFSSNNAAEALLMYDNDKDKALAHILSSS